MAYTQISDYAIQDFVSYQLVNTLVDSLRYVAEDILGIAHGDDDGLIDSIGLNNGATHGGAIFFNGGSSKFLKCDAAGTYLELDGMYLDVTSPNVIRGDRFTIPLFGFYTVGADGYVTTRDVSRSGGFKAPNSGSIIGISFAVNNINLGTFTVQAEVHKNASNVLASSGLAFTGQAYLTTSTTQARGTDTFVADDYIDAFINFTSGADQFFFGIGIEVVFDKGGPDD